MTPANPSSTKRRVLHVLSAPYLTSGIFEDLIARSAAAAPEGWEVLRAQSAGEAEVLHFHRPNLEWRLPAHSVVTVHHDLDETESWLRLGTFLPGYRQAAAVICLNKAQHARLAPLALRRLELIPHGIDRRVLPLPQSVRRARQPGHMTLGLISNRSRRGAKGEELFVALLQHLDPARISFVLAGAGRWREAALARERGFAVETFGSLPYALFGALYDRIDALLVTSRFEGGPASAPEAAGLGIPVLGTKVGMIPDLVADGVNGLLLEGNAARDAARIMALTEEESLSALMSGAFTRAPKMPDWQSVMARHFALYAEIAR